MVTVYEKEATDYKAKMAQYDGNQGKVDDYLPSSGQGATYSRRKAPAQRKWTPTPTDENKRSDEWLGGSSPNGKPPKRSWKVKAAKTVIPDGDSESS
jgi:hypothetical protein